MTNTNKGMSFEHTKYSTQKNKGIYKGYNYYRGHFETLPLSNENKVSIYHIRQFQIWQLSLMHSLCIDIMLSHDWPSCAPKFGNYHSLIRFKKHFKNDLQQGQLGSFKYFVFFFVFLRLCAYSIQFANPPLKYDLLSVKLRVTKYKTLHKKNTKKHIGDPKN